MKLLSKKIMVFGALCLTNFLNAAEVNELTSILDSCYEYISTHTSYDALTLEEQISLKEIIKLGFDYNDELSEQQKKNLNELSLWAADILKDEPLYRVPPTPTDLVKIVGGLGLKASNLNTVVLSPALTTSSWTFQFPPDAGNPGDILTTDGTGVITWQASGFSACEIVSSCTYFIIEVPNGLDAYQLVIQPETAIQQTLQLAVVGSQPDISLEFIIRGSSSFYIETDLDTLPFFGIPTALGGQRGALSIDLQLTRTWSGQVASGLGSAMFGGIGNTASGPLSIVVGGFGNFAESPGSAVFGGSGNTVSGANGAIVAGAGNGASATDSVVVGGFKNDTDGLQSVVVGGNGNAITNFGDNSGILAGATNSIDAALGAVVGGSSNAVNASGGAIAGGNGNTVTNLGLNSGILAGITNQANADYCAVVAGSGNVVNSTQSVIVGGNNNTIAIGSDNSVILAGSSNTIVTGCNNSAVLAGNSNAIGGLSSSAPNSIAAGESCATTGAYACAFGRAANAGPGSFVFADGSGGGLASAGANTFNILATGGVFMPSSVTGVTVTGAAVLIDATTGKLGTISSARRYKENIKPMSDEYSANILELQPVTFNYKKTPSVESFGLVADDVREFLPQLVVYNKDGEVETVKYHELPVLLLNELKKQHALMKEMRGELNALQEQVHMLLHPEDLQIVA